VPLCGRGVVSRVTGIPRQRFGWRGQFSSRGDGPLPSEPPGLCWVLEPLVQSDQLHRLLLLDLPIRFQAPL